MKNKNILIINGSTRSKGNTDIVVNKIIDGAQDSQLVVLKDKKISDCIGYAMFRKKHLLYWRRYDRNP